MVFELCSTNSIGNHFLAELRDVEIQKDRLRFRRNLERIGELLAYELSKSLRYKPHIVKTSLGESSVHLIENRIVVGAGAAADVNIITVYFALPGCGITRLLSINRSRQPPCHQRNNP